MLISKFPNCNVQQRIVDIEKQYCIVLPVQYKKFLHKYNGGYTPKTKFAVRGISSDLRGFFGVGDVALSLDKLKLGGCLQDNLLPIACDSFGNYILIGLSNEDTGNIFFCDHEKGNKVEYLTETLKQFIECCRSEKIGKTRIRSIKEREDALIANGRGHVITDALREMWQAEIDKYGSVEQEELLIV